jgi:predicted Zn-dependent protease
MHLSAGRRERAADLVRPLTRSEPENVTAWTILALAESDPRAARRADARRRALAPPVNR